MFTKLSVKNFKSIKNIDLDLGLINVFIGENGSGKSNILEAIAMLSAAKSDSLSNESLAAKGVRIARPDLTINSFLGKPSNSKIEIKLSDDKTTLKSMLVNENQEDVFSNWKDEEFLKATSIVQQVLSEFLDENKSNEFVTKRILESGLSEKNYDLLNKHLFKKVFGEQIFDYVIYNLNSNALRGISNDSKKEPLGLNGENLDVLLSIFSNEQMEEMKSYNFISWLDDIEIDLTDSYKLQGFKMGRSNSKLYFKDKYMKKSNSLFSAENANEGALHIIFYLSLFISKKTPGFFAIDNIETALNPQLCRNLIKTFTILAPIHNKQALITTHNPAILDGLNLKDNNQRLFIVRRNDDGATAIDPVLFKPIVNEGKYKLSELWMRGFLGGLPNINF
jgi:predicted ATPase